MRPGVQILLPGLFDLPLEELDDGLLRDGLPEDYSIDALLSAVLFGQSTQSSAGLPVAQAFTENAENGERCMLLEAMHFQADMQGAIAVPIVENSKNVHDIDIIINDLKELFNEDCDITALGAGRYLMELHNFIPPTHYPHPLSVLGKRVGAYIEQSREVLPWYRLVNEFQMFMYQHPVNAERLQQGQLPINSLWAWGAGTLPQPTSHPAWYCDDELLNRFATSLELPVTEWTDLGSGEIPELAVIVDLRLLQLLKSGSDARPEELLLDIEQTILAPVMSRRPRCLTLRAAYHHDFVLARGSGLRFWRRSVNLLDWR